MSSHSPLKVRLGMSTLYELGLWNQWTKSCSFSCLNCWRFITFSSGVGQSKEIPLCHDGTTHR